MDLFFSLKIYRKVAEAKSFKAAADHFNLSPTAVSKHVQFLEDRVGTKLLNRTTRAVSLTEAGQLYLRKSSEMIENLEETEASLKESVQKPQGTLKIGGPLGFGHLHLARLAVKFMKQFPEISVHLELTDRFIDMIEEGYDLTVRISNEMKNSNLVAVKLGKIRAVTVASSHYLKEHGLPRTPDDLKNHDCLISSTHPNSWKYKSKSRLKHVEVKGRFHSNNTQTLKEALLLGQGIAYLPLFYVANEVQSGKLKILLSNYEMAQFDLYLLFPPTQNLPSKVRAFVDFMKNEAQKLNFLNGEI